jgi:hypothetical protein
MIQTPQLDLVIQNLATHPSYLRIRQLLWVMCYQQWENDVTKLTSKDLQTLLQKLYELFPTCETAQTALNQIVNGLNKKAEYQKVSHYILSQLQVGYAAGNADPVTITAMTVDNTPVSALPLALEEVAQAIAWHEKGFFMQQLLFQLCRKSWQANAEKIAMLNTKSLLIEAYTAYPTFNQLQGVLMQAVEAAPPEMEYIWAADALSELMWKLYPASEEPNTLLTIASNPVSETFTAPLKLIQTVNPHATVLEDKTQATLLEPEPQPTPINLTAADPFAVRFDIMGQTNALRAKIVLFSVLYYPFDFTYHAWMELREHSLNALLDQLCRTYHELETIEHRLIHMARSLPDADQHIQAAQTLVRAVRRHYCGA